MSRQPQAGPPPRIVNRLTIVLAVFGAIAFVILVVLVLAMHDFSSAVEPAPQPGYPAERAK